MYARCRQKEAQKDSRSQREVFRVNKMTAEQIRVMTSQRGW